MVELEEKTDLLPICPHCKTEINRVYFQELRGVLGKRYIYYCSNCRSVFGVTHRKGFWMG